MIRKGYQNGYNDGWERGQNDGLNFQSYGNDVCLKERGMEDDGYTAGYSDGYHNGYTEAAVPRVPLIF